VSVSLNLPGWLRALFWCGGVGFVCRLALVYLLDQRDQRTSRSVLLSTYRVVSVDDEDTTGRPDSRVATLRALLGGMILGYGAFFAALLIVTFSLFGLFGF